MRKALKGLRYTCEFFLSLYPEPKANLFLKEIRALQDVFGYLNDVVAARRLGAICAGESGEAQRAAAYILGWHSAQAKLARRHTRAGRNSSGRRISGSDADPAQLDPKRSARRFRIACALLADSLNCQPCARRTMSSAVFLASPSAPLASADSQ
jgi:CHAD domain